MASPGVFRSPSSRTPRRELETRSSSPEFPSLNDIVPSAPSRPPFLSPNKSNPVSNDISIVSLHSTDEKQSDQPKPKTKAARTKRAPRSKYFEGDQPWKKYKSPPKTRSQESEGKAEGKSADPVSIAFPTPDAVSVLDKDASLILLEDNPVAKKAPKKPKAKEKDEPLSLDLAPSRRTDWTPPTKTTSTHINLGSDTSVIQDTAIPTQLEDNNDMFKSLLETYGCDMPQPEPIVVSEEDSSFLKKRKLIEMVTTADGAESPPVSPEKSRAKPKAAKKKARTITELATAAYQPPAAPEATDPTQTQLSFARTDIAQDTEATSKNGKGKAKAKSAKKPKKTTAKSKKKAEPVLLSPGTALKQSAAQDFVFGTSSQLVREQSPTLLRDIQIAMRNSNLEMAHIDEEDPFLDSTDLEPVAKKSSLWHAGARDDDGGLLDIELVDLVDEPSQLPPMDDGGDPFGYSKPDILPILPQQEQGVEDADASFETLSDLLPAPKRKAPDIDENSEFSLSDISVSTDVRKPDPLSTVVGSEAEQQSIEAGSKLSTVPTSTEPHRPKFELYTDTQLARQIKGYGFKAVKRRSAMIALLDQCWRSKHGVPETAARAITTSSAVSQPRKDASSAAATIDKGSSKARGRPRKTPSSPVVIQEPPPSAQPIESPKRPRGRPKKADKAGASSDEDATAPSTSPKKGRGRSKKVAGEAVPVKPAKKAKPKAATKAATKTTKKTTPAPSTPVKKKSAKFQDVLEIPDSASDNGSVGSVFSSSPEPTFSPPPGVDLSVSMEEDTSLLPVGSPSAQQSSVFERITEAVTTAPRSTDPQNPSWHEKILMYDPIILEDLASWLNSGQLSRVGHDDEVSPGEVKKWCESQSICCLWRLNMRGVSRKRY